MSLIWILAALGCIAIGMKGFTPKGIPLTKDHYIQGKNAKITGYIFIGLGVLMFALLEFWSIWWEHFSRVRS